jgi:predicted RNA-binding protein Jag
MDRIQRKLVHELVQHYNLESKSVNREPTRSIQIIKRKDSKM